MRFVTTLWNGHAFWKPVVKYSVEHVERLASMLNRHGGHKLTVVHDGTFDLPRQVDAIRMPDEVASLPDYQPKLWLWSRELGETIGERYAAIDLDVVVLADLAPMLAANRRIPHVPLAIWDEAVGEPYNTSLFAVEPDYARAVWTTFAADPRRLQIAAANATRWTGDQSWVAHVIQSRDLIKPMTFSERDGVLRYRGRRDEAGVPEGTKAVFFCGPMCPKTVGETVPWVRACWK